MSTSSTAGYRESNRATLVLALGTLAWLGTLALARFGPALWGEGNEVAGWLAVAVNVAAGIVWIVIFTRYLRAIDDLQRKIMLDALAITLGVGWVAGFGYVVADAAGLIPQPVDVAVLPAGMGVVFIIATVVGTLRYR